MAGRDDEWLQALVDWDYTMAADRPEPLLFATWHRALARAVYADELGPLFPRLWRQRARFLTAVLTDRDGQSRWCDDTTSPSTESCAHQVAIAFDAARAELAARQTGDWRDWQWGAVHQAVQPHRPFSNVPMLKSWFETRSAIGGGSNTVDVARGSWRDGNLHEVGHGASYRAVYDLADLDNSRYVIPTGQSENPLSGHYRDQVSLWSEGRYITIPTDLAQLEAPRALRLTPE
jgi:penicillin amidase